VRQTIIVAAGHAAAQQRLALAREGRHGVEVRSMEQVAARLAGGFRRPVDSDVLCELAGEVVRDASPDQLGDLNNIADLPGLPTSLAATLTKTWQAGIELAALAPDAPRLAALAGLETAILARLPTGMLRLPDLVKQALQRLDHAPALLGSVECRFLPDLPPCSRPLLIALARRVKVTWNAGPRPVPEWVQDTDLRIITAPPIVPDLRVITCATARHEVIEAMRWARGLLASGNVQAQDIAFASAAPGEFDDLVLAMSQEANIDVHFGHGRRANAFRDGQTAAALADILLRGLSQDRVRRLARMSNDAATPFGRLPDDWAATLPRSAPLGTPQRWRQALVTGSLNNQSADVLLGAIDLLAKGPEAAEQAGEMFLRGTARLLWRRALARAPASALEASLGGLRLPDQVEPGTAIVWLHAASLAEAPRPYVWLFGLNARTWPRRSSEDPLLPSYLVPASQLDPLPVTEADRSAFRTIRTTTAAQLTCSASRRDANGRLLGLSPLLPANVAAVRLRRTRIPEHAMSEQDRMMARPHEFATTVRSVAAWECWQDWNTAGLTPHDGLIRPDHPVLHHAVNRVHSASSLKMLLRNPLGFAWRYALGWREPDIAEEAMDLDAMSFGNLVHAILNASLPAIEAAGGLDHVGPAAIESAVTGARQKVAEDWEAALPVPPAILWRMRLNQAQAMAQRALSWPLTSFSAQRSYGEVPFGDPVAASPADAPWDVTQSVTIPTTDLRILGRIDRLDLAADRTRARVVDYKTGKPRDAGTLDGGKELQRCLYAYAVRSLLGPAVTVEAALLYPRGESNAYQPLLDTGGALETLTAALSLARNAFLAGHAVPGPDTGGDYDDLRFALPASPGGMIDRKREAGRILLEDAALVWEIA